MDIKKLRQEIKNDMRDVGGKYNIKWSDQARQERIYKAQISIIAIAFAIASLIALYYLIESGKNNAELGVILNNNKVVGTGITN